VKRFPNKTSNKTFRRNSFRTKHRTKHFGETDSEQNIEQNISAKQIPNRTSNKTFRRIGFRTEHRTKHGPGFSTEQNNKHNIGHGLASKQNTTLKIHYEQNLESTQTQTPDLQVPTWHELCQLQNKTLETQTTHVGESGSEQNTKTKLATEQHRTQHAPQWYSEQHS
jgi:hypothetical protein